MLPALSSPPLSANRPLGESTRPVPPQRTGPGNDGASRDLKQLHEAGLLVAHGEKRGRYYTAADELQEIRRRIVSARDPRDDSDPFAGV